MPPQLMSITEDQLLAVAENLPPLEDIITGLYLRALAHRVEHPRVASMTFDLPGDGMAFLALSKERRDALDALISGFDGGAEGGTNRLVAGLRERIAMLEARVDELLAERMHAVRSDVVADA